MDEDKIVLDRKSFEALAVDTRVRILKSLKARRKTLSEISKEQGMSVSGVKEHLETLEGVGLIEKKDDGHKWKYYELTKKGSEIVAPREIRVWILLSISAIALVASMIAMLSPPAMMAEQASSPGSFAVPNATEPPQLMMASAAVADNSSEGGATAGAGEAAAAARDFSANGAAEPPAPEAKLATGENATAGQAQPASDEAKAPDLTMPALVGAISALTLVACVGILVRNRMRPASL